MTSRRIRWDDRTLSPYELTFVPPNCRAVTDPNLARQRIRDVLTHAELPAHRAQRYLTLWDSCLYHGLQESGLVVACLRALADAVGLPSSAITRQWSAWCIDQQVWVSVPGRLYSRHPRARDPHLGLRTRAYLVIAPLS